MGKNKDRKKKGASTIQKTVTKTKKKVEKELKKQIEQLGEVILIFKINQISQFLFRIISNN